jgi:guanylate kinase
MLRVCRQRRHNERDGVDYHFVSKAQFEQWIAEGALLEHAIVYGEHKGIPRAQVMDQLTAGRDVVMRVDVQGAATLRERLPHVVSAFLVAGTERELVRRLLSRGTEDDAALIKRASTIQAECQEASSFDYVVVNEEGGVERAAQQLAAILDAERCRVFKGGWARGHQK